MRGVLVWGSVVLLNVAVMFLVNRRRLRRRESATMEGTLLAAFVSTLLAHGFLAVRDVSWVLMWLPFTVVGIGGGSLLSSWLLLIFSERWSGRFRARHDSARHADSALRSTSPP